jgi:hypothetical protein
MNKKIRNMAIVLIIGILITGALYSDVFKNQGHIKRLTFSGNNAVHFPCLSDD